MKGKRKKQRRRLMKPVVVGFAAIYLTIMLLSTYLVKVQFENDYDDTLKETLSNIQRRIYDQEYEPPELWDDTAKQVWYQSVTNNYPFICLSWLNFVTFFTFFSFCVILKNSVNKCAKGMI